MANILWQIVLLLYLLSGICGSDIIPDGSCATFYSGKYLESETFVLKDFDQSLNMKKDYRTSSAGWNTTGSYVVENSCKMNICNGPYFTGACFPIPSSYPPPVEFIQQISSANCTCSRECSCENVILQQNEYGRAYLKGGCGVCDSEYFSLTEISVSQFSSIEGISIEDFVVCSGCSVNIYSEMNFQGKSAIISANSNQNALGAFRSYRFVFNEGTNAARVVGNQTSHTPLIKLPDTREGLMQLYTSNGTTYGHPGLEAALNSLASGRSWRNAYILLIGGSHPEDSGINNCPYPPLDTIGECHLKVNLDHLGISNTELRIIFYRNVGGGFSGTSKLDDDYRLMASMDEYLSSHEDLQNAIPNAVIIRESITSSKFAKAGSIFQRKLQMLNALRVRVLDENYSNVIYELSGLEYLSLARNPQKRIEEFEQAIMAKWEFPKPLHIYTSMNVARETRKVNGYSKFVNGEYWPRNLEENLNLISRKAGNDLSYAIFTSNFRNQGNAPSGKIKSMPLVARNHSKITAFKEFVTIQSNGSIEQIISFLEMRSLITQKRAARLINEKYKISSAIHQLAEKDFKNRIQYLEGKLVEERNARIADIKTLKQKMELEFQEKVNSLSATLKEMIAVEREARESASARIKDEIVQGVKDDLAKLYSI